MNLVPLTQGGKDIYFPVPFLTRTSFLARKFHNLARTICLINFTCFRLETLSGKADDLRNFRPFITDVQLTPSLIGELVRAYLRASDRVTEVKYLNGRVEEKVLQYTVAQSLV